MSSPTLYILWDESPLWGLLAWRGARGLGLPYRMVRAEEIRQSLLSDNPPAMLLVPGGTARLKSEALGPEGMQNIRDYVAAGGHYLGFCGGAGLGLTPAQGKESEALGLCPWSRAAYTDRIQHFMSGHLYASFPQPEHPLGPPIVKKDGSFSDLSCELTSFFAPLLPVWWPGRFKPDLAPQASPLAGKACILAEYGPPGADFWLADLPTRLLPKGAYSDWQNLYGVSLSPEFLDGQPCLVHGCYGVGTYTLSYSHLETPNSPFANAWLAKILRDLGGFAPESASIPVWQLDDQPIVWPEADLLRTRHLLRGLLDLGQQHNLLFRRNDWLYGWRSGIPGMQLTSLYAALASIVSLPPGEAALAFWSRHKAEVMKKLEIFAEAAANYLLAERLAMTLSKSEPDTVSSRLLAGQRASLFGERMRPGGIYKEITDVIDELAWLQIEG